MGNAALVYSITGASPASAITAAIGSAIDTTLLPGTTTEPGLDCVDSIDVIAAVQGATGGTLDLVLQTSPDGTTYTDYAHITQLASAAAAIVYRFSCSRFAQQTTLATVGQGILPVLANSTIIGGPIARFIRLVGKAGSSTSAGATQTLTITATGARKQA